MYGVHLIEVFGIRREERKNVEIGPITCKVSFTLLRICLSPYLFVYVFEGEKQCLFTLLRFQVNTL